MVADTATCINSGYAMYVCAECGMTKLVPSVGGHKYVATQIEPTEENIGYKGQVCIHCGEFVVEEVLETVYKPSGTVNEQKLDTDGNGSVDKEDYELLREKMLEPDAKFDRRYDILEDGSVDILDFITLKLRLEADKK